MAAWLAARLMPGSLRCFLKHATGSIPWHDAGRAGIPPDACIF